MSPNVSSFVSELAEMAQATMRLPQVEGELRSVQADLERAKDTIQRLEQRLMDRASEIESLHRTVREAEVSRDDAEIRFLEADDRTEKALAFVRSVFGNAGALIQALEPPRPEPTPAESEAMAVPGSEPVPGVSVSADPTSAPSTDTLSPSVPSVTPSDTAKPENTATEPTYGQNWGAPQTDAAPTSQGQSEDRPTVTSAMEHGTQDANVLPATAPQTMPTEAPEPRYAGKLYIRVPGWVSYHDWIEGGGTVESYYWRDGEPLPEGIAA